MLKMIIVCCLFNNKIQRNVSHFLSFSHHSHSTASYFLIVISLCAVHPMCVSHCYGMSKWLLRNAVVFLPLFILWTTSMNVENEQDYQQTESHANLCQTHRHNLNSVYGVTQFNKHGKFSWIEQHQLAAYKKILPPGYLR